jgi:hypothetical protein
MARFVAGVMAGVVLTTIAGAALGIHAQADDVAAAAAAAGVDERDLRGALNSQAMHGLTADPWTYLRSNRELPSLPPSASNSPAAPTSGVWDRLVRCEASGNWHANTGNGYYGGVQEDMAFWRNYGYDVDHPGALMATRPDLATPGQQVIAAERGLKAQGWGAWPACSRALGLR